MGSQRWDRLNGWAWLPLGALVLAVDQLSKQWIVQHFQIYEHQHLLSVLDLVRWHTDEDPFLGRWRGFYPLMFAAGVAGMLRWLWCLKALSDARAASALTLILGGATSNIADRVWRGQVIAFLLPHWNQAYMPVFNLADLALTAGAILLLIDLGAQLRIARATPDRGL